MPPTEDTRPITVSRDALRAELVSLELRLTEKINTMLETKASAAVVEQIEKRLTAIEFTSAVTISEAKSAKEQASKNDGNRKWILAQAIALAAVVVSVIYVYIQVKQLH